MERSIWKEKGKIYMKKYIFSTILLILTIGTLCGCILPKEEELVTSPIVEAYQREDFKTATVERGDLTNVVAVDCVVLGINEKVLSFDVEDKAFKGVYVKQGDHVEANAIVAELVADGLTSVNLMKLRSPISGTVTYAMDVKNGEKSIINKKVVVVNSGSSYYLIAQSPYWEQFSTGQVHNVRFKEGVFAATVIEPEEIGMERLQHTGEENEVYPVYFRIDDASAYLYSDLRGTISITLGEEKDVLYIPASAVTTINDKEVVYYEDEDGIRNVKYIETGLEANGKIEVKDGLNEGDKIILE